MQKVIELQFEMDSKLILCSAYLSIQGVTIKTVDSMLIFEILGTNIVVFKLQDEATTHTCHLLI